jgi:hypothetical protein
MRRHTFRQPKRAPILLIRHTKSLYQRLHSGLDMRGYAPDITEVTGQSAGKEDF